MGQQVEIRSPAAMPPMFGETLTMSSREIAALCEKRHDHVLRDIKKMLRDIDAPNFGAVDFTAEYRDAKGEARKEYRLPKDLTVTLITGYRADLRYRVVKRLEELEGEQKHSAVLSGKQLMAAALIEANSTMEAQAMQIESMKGDVAALEQIEAMSGSLSIRPAAKVLGIPEHKLKTWLQVNRWAFRQSGKGPLQAYTDKRNVGYLDHKHGEYTKSDGEKGISITLMVTPKGLTRLAKIFAKGGDE